MTGAHSLECPVQEDTLLVLLNTSTSNLASVYPISGPHNCAEGTPPVGSVFK